MVLNSLGIDIAKGTFAGLAKDQRGMYGNWSYNVAAAGELGTNAYVVQLTNVEDLKEYIAAGQPVVVSIRSSASNPLTGAPMNILRVTSWSARVLPRLTEWNTLS
jgi:hypothetical protein